MDVEKGGTMGGEGFFSALGGMMFGALGGLLVSLSLKLFTRGPNLPLWPIVLFAVVGGVLPAVVQSWRYA
jgi:hypothetical protein